MAFSTMVLTYTTFFLLLCAPAVAEEKKCPVSSAEIRAAVHLALKNADQISNKYLRDQELQEVAKVYAHNADFAPALEIIQTDSAYMWQAADDLTKYMLRCAKSSEVKAIAPTLQGLSPSHMLQRLAEWQATHDDPVGAQATVAQIKDANVGLEAQVNIVMSAAIAGHSKNPEAELRKALEGRPAGLSSTDDIVQRDMAIVLIAEGKIEAAVERLNKIERDKVYAFYMGAQVLAARKNKYGALLLAPHALKVAKPFLKDSDKAYPISLLATALGAAGAFDEALELANAISDQQRRDEALVMISTELINVGEEPRAMAALESLRKLPDNAGEEARAQRDFAFVKIAIAEANAGHAQEALIRLGAIHDPRFNDVVTMERAYAHAQAGDMGKALSLAAEMPPPEFPKDLRVHTFRLIAAVDAYKNGTSSAMKWAAQLNKPEDRMPAYLGIADGLLEKPSEDIPPYFED